MVRTTYAQRNRLGVDSSAVVALASEVSGARLETFSIGFDKPRYAEREHARYVTRRFGTRHHEFVLEPGIASPS